MFPGIKGSEIIPSGANVRMFCQFLSASTIPSYVKASRELGMRSYAGGGYFLTENRRARFVTGEDKGRRAASDHSGWRSNHDGHPDFVVNFSLGLWSLSACVACACTCFENLAPKYLYQLILVNFFLVLISIINHLLYLSKLVLLPVSGMSKTW